MSQFFAIAVSLEAVDPKLPMDMKSVSKSLMEVTKQQKLFLQCQNNFGNNSFRCIPHSKEARNHPSN